MKFLNSRKATLALALTMISGTMFYPGSLVNAVYNSQQSLLERNLEKYPGLLQLIKKSRANYRPPFRCILRVLDPYDNNYRGKLKETYDQMVTLAQEVDIRSLYNDAEVSNIALAMRNKFYEFSEQFRKATEDEININNHNRALFDDLDSLKKSYERDLERCRTLLAEK